jgi:hypothetical protein
LSLSSFAFIEIFKYINRTTFNQTRSLKMINYSIRFLIILALIVTVSACVTPPPETSHDGLKLVDGSAFSIVYLKPGADIASYLSFALADCQVAFKKDWLRDQNRDRMRLNNRVTQEDVDKIKASLSKSCNSIFKNELEQAPAYKLVNASATGNQVLLIKPSIIDLDVTAPDLSMSQANRSRTYTTTSGEMTLFMELHDAATGEILARVIDKKKDNQSMNLEWSNSVTNKSDAERVLRQWSSKLRKGLDQLRGNNK